MHSHLRSRTPSAVRASLLAAALATLGASAFAEIRVMCYQDGNECDVTADLIKRYEETGKRVRERYVPKPFNGSNDDETLQRLETMMMTAASGNRNATLNEVGFILGLNVAQGRIDKSWGMSTIASAAQRVGLDDREIDYHLRRAVENGMDAAMMNLNTNTKGMH